MIPVVPVVFVYILIGLSLVVFKEIEVRNDPDAMPACGHLGGWYAAAAIWPIVFAVVTVIATAIIAGVLIVEFWER